METKEKVSFIHSITAKIMLMVVVMVALSLMACISIANVRASATVSNVNEKFILSLTESAAKTLDKIPAEVDFSTQCAAVMQDMRMEGVSSAYGYLVDSDGTMLYHPTADKIGKSVENEVVKGVVSQLQSGNIPQDAVVTYNFNGTVKYAAYALTSDHKIVVMSADKGEIMEPITNMVRLMAVTMGVCLIICCLAAWLLTNMITKPIHQLTYIITRTANFDFTHNANSRKLYSRKDEIGIMAAEMHIMRKNLREMVTSIQDAGQKINENVSELNEVTDTVNQMCSDNSATSQQLAAVCRRQQRQLLRSMRTCPRSREKLKISMPWQRKVQRIQKLLWIVLYSFVPRLSPQAIRQWIFIILSRRKLKKQLKAPKQLRRSMN